MPLDTLYRHQQALDPSALTIVAGVVHAVAAAIVECRAAGIDPERDPAVIPLARHLGRIAEAVAADDDALRSACAERIVAIRDRPFDHLRTRLRMPVQPDRPRIAA